MARSLGGALGEGYLGADGVGAATCLVGAHDAGTRASVGGLLYWLEPGRAGRIGAGDP